MSNPRIVVTGIGALVDLIMIACGTFTDSDGKPVTDWQT